MADHDREQDLGLPREALEAWTPLEPTQDFAERLVNRLESTSSDDHGAIDDGESSPRAARLSRNRKHIALAAAAAAVALVIIGALLAFRQGSDATSGEVVADRRQTISIGKRAVAVAEAGAELRWSVDASGLCRVHQTRGKVFYRVERDATQPFVVVAPDGEVRVLGTSFHVEVEPMRHIVTKRNAASAAIGAALSAALVVTVYEGRVALATDRGETEVGPGEIAWAHRGEPPSAAVDVVDLAQSRIGSERSGDGSDPSGALEDDDLPAPVLRERLAALRAEREEQQAELESLRARVRALGDSPDGGPSTTQRLRSQPWYPPDQADLEELVAQCGIRSDLPPVMGLEPGLVGNHAERMGLAQGEIPVVEEAIRQLHRSFLESMRPLYLEATGDEVGAQTLSADAMMAQINAAAMEGEVREAHRQIARELAGQAEPPSSVDDLPPAARALRLYVGLGDELQQLLASELGEHRSHELRAAAGGWPWGRSYSRACEGQ